MRITSDGYVGFGTDTPQALVVSKETTDVEAINFVAEAKGATGDTAGYYFTAHNVDTPNRKAAILLKKTGDFGVGDMHFVLDSNTDDASLSQANDTKMSILSDGKVGIGTTGPSYKLDVEHNVASYVASIVNPNTGTGQGLLIQSSNSSPGGQELLKIETTGTSLFEVHANGKVGIGTTTPAVALSVANRSSSTTAFLEVVKIEGVCTGTVANGFGPNILYNGSMTGQDNVELGYLGYKNDSVGGAYGTFALYTRPNSTSVERLRVIYSGDTYTNDGTISSLSDIRAKKDVTDLTDGLDIVNQLRPRTFKYNGKTSLGTDDGVTRYGFIADEVLSVASHYVNITAEDVDGERVEDFKTLSTTKMIPMLVNSIQELSAKNDALEAKVTALESA